jgi:acyl-CoA synthetase (AMP-forming)/AMP-acid ligase II/pimeloyl-ACP methyl ester carboxylesterase
VSLCRAAGVAVVATTTYHIDLGFELVGTLGAGLLLVDRCHHPLVPGDPTANAPVTPNPHPLAKPLAEGEVKEVVPMPVGCSLDDGMVVLFTSGTTAEPKAMELTHRAALHHVAFYAAEFASKQPQPVVAACMSALVFDMHISEIFPAWATGGCVALLDAPDNDLHARVRCLEDATLSMWVPSVLRSCLQAFTAMGRGAPRMQQVFVAGEQLVASLVQGVFDAWPSVKEVVNAYGPAETHVVTVHRVHSSTWPLPSLRESPAVPIGKALPGVGLALRNTTTSSSGGQEGELLVSGPCLANGYIGNLSKTSEKFLVDGQGVRWYRTGDHVERNVDGDWVFMGRIDAMLKNRGRRIEPEWVEACAREVGAEEALLCSIEDELVLAYAGDADKEKVREHLASTLDTYSVPDHLVRLPPGFTWPRLASGKLDRSSAAGQVTAIRNAETGSESTQIDPHCNSIVAAFVAAVESVSAGSRSIDPKKPLQLNSIQVMTLIGILNLTPGQARMLKNMPECSVEALAIQIHNCTCTAPELQTPLRVLAELEEEDGKRREEEHLPVFICPGAFGRTSNLRILAKELAKEGIGPVYGFETPFTEPRPGSISDLSALFVEAIVDAQVKLGDKGCFIVGQSFGALLALSMEAELVRKGHRVNAVVALDPRRQCWLDASSSDAANSETNDDSEPPAQAKGLQGHLRYTAALRAITMGSPELRLIYDEIRGATNPCEEFRSRMPYKHRNQTRAILRETETMVSALVVCRCACSCVSAGVCQMHGCVIRWMQPMDCVFVCL